MRARAWIVWAVVMAGGCVPKGQPTLEISLTPKTVTDGTPVLVKLTATAGDGKIGTGRVKITSASGSLVTPAEVTLDGYGTATTELTCDPTTEPDCAQSVRVAAEWTSDAVAVTAEARLNSAGAAGTGGSGGATGSGGGGGTTGSGGGGGTTGMGGGGGTTGLGGGGGGLLDASSRVLLFGTLSEGSCGADALTDPRTPTKFAVAFPCYANPLSAKRVNGTLYYSVTFSPGLYKFREDTWDRINGSSVFPSSTKNPDTVLFADCGDFYGFWISPAGRVLHHCPAKDNMGNLFIDGVPSPFVGMSIPLPLAFGEQDSVLTQDTVITSDHVVHPITPPIFSAGPSLAVAGGFLVASRASATTCDLYRVGLDGMASKQGSYPVGCGTDLEPDGTMTSISNDGNAKDTIVEVPLNGTPTTIYTEANAFAPDYSLNPPRAYVMIHGSALVSGN